MGIFDPGFASLLTASTKTSSGQYDQVIAISQDMLNQLFVDGKLFLHPEFKTINYPGSKSGNPNGVSLTFQFDSTKIAFDVNLRCFVVSLYVKAGSITILSDAINISGAVFTFRYSIGEGQLLRPKDGTYFRDVIGVGRSPYRWDWDATLWPNGNGGTIPFQQWMSDAGINGLRTQFLLYTFLGEYDGYLATLGLDPLFSRIVYETLNITPLQTSFPTSFYTLYPYQGDNFGGNYGNKDALVICSMIGRNLGTTLSDPDLLQTGNYCTLDSEPGTNDGVNGTLMLSRRYFFEKVFCPRVQRMNQAADIVFNDPSFYVDENNNIQIVENYTIGMDSAHPDANKPPFNYIWDQNQQAYVFFKVNNHPWVQFKNPSREDYIGCTEQVTVNNAVTFEPGTPTIHMKGSTRVYSTTKRGTDPAFAKPDAYSIITDYTVNWQATFTLADPDTDIKSLDQGRVYYTGNLPDVKIDIVGGLDQRAVRGDFYFKLWTAFQAFFADETSLIPYSDGPHVVPANGMFHYQNQVFTNSGDLRARIFYHRPQ
ncbi:hypothetical protein H072_6667 [Dactylellina haptotyla CBS 200.50]|uniref:Uncharacterized protein n=1 Tax=Dactylellina haptotyla (strain CBS 200.50) TaxID=1284197 RepID=S8BW61_DACHA|nr:hypothetical protein H072_6667 [Dactylellina haptotyla CBS 200.50]